MTIIAGAIQYLNSAKLANSQGRPAGQSTLMNNMSVDILDIGRSINRSGIGISANARAMTKDFLNKSQSGVNAIFGMSTVKSSSIENMQMQINAIRSRTPDSQVAEALRGKNIDEQA